MTTTRVIAKKSLGQHFIVTPGVLSRIAGLVVEGAPPDLPILEIGAGTGALTDHLIGRGRRVLALEKDRRLVDLLARRLAGQAEIVEADALTHDLGGVLAGGPMLVAGNLPYNVASPILFRILLAYRGRIRRMVLMFQKEVAERITAKPGNKTYGILAILTGLFCRAKLEFTVSPAHFRPRPKVASAVVSFDVLPAPQVNVADPELFLAVAKACLAHRRKTLRNNLAPWLTARTDSPPARAMADLPVDPTRRGETLTLQELADITRWVERLLHP